jgi:hypothetical protein
LTLVQVQVIPNSPTTTQSESTGALIATNLMMHNLNHEESGIIMHHTASLRLVKKILLMHYQLAKIASDALQRRENVVALIVMHYRSDVELE